MSIQDYIAWPDGHTYLTIRQAAIDICDGHKGAAILLSLFESYHKSLLKKKEQGEAIHKSMEEDYSGDEKYFNTSLLQYHTLEDLKVRVMNLIGRPNIEAGIKILIEKKFITVHKNPIKRLAFDNTKHFLFHPDVVSTHVKAYVENDGQSNTNCKTVTQKLTDGTTETDKTIYNNKDTNKDNNNITLADATHQPYSSKPIKKKIQGGKGYKKSTKGDILEDKKTTSEEVVKKFKKENLKPEEVLSEYIENPKANITFDKLAEFWKRLHVSVYPGKPVAILTKKQRGQLKTSVNAYEDLDPYALLGRAIMNWEEFCKHCKKVHGAFNMPEMPTIQFIAQYRHGLGTFLVEAEESKTEFDHSNWNILGEGK